MIKVLSVTSECAPLVKTGGLADVAGALPGALAEHGVQMRTLLPGYPVVMAALGKTKLLFEEPDLFGGKARILSATIGALELIIIDAPHLYNRPGSIYLGPDGKDWPDNPARFAALSWVAALIGAKSAKGWLPNVIHCHDWQAGFVTDYLDDMLPKGARRPGTMMTIHNMAFQGLVDATALDDLHLRSARLQRSGFEFWGKISALKAGLTGADRLTTVSPTYAAEIMREEFGMGLHGVMHERRDVLHGILNGIDEQVWDPATDPNIATFKTPQGKKRAKAALRRALGLPKADGPLCVVITRLTSQKGLDMLLDAVPALTARGGQLALLGSGDPALEAAFTKLAETNPNVSVTIGYDEPFSHRLMAGGDAILVPSRFEPCGLTQLYGLRYGTVPVVALTGGLADTVINASPAALASGCATGIQFYPVAFEPFERALIQLCDLFSLGAPFTKIQKNAMRSPVGWSASAAQYVRLYKEIAPQE
ncbi:MAG: glycogen synthase GlgA [Rhodobacteraceae bacterium]|nr:glycogen synthase GlgA [Paracoccaceae bacterium]